jgi:hypothetical protein
MERLPRVLQNEIQEYVRGDGAHWKAQFEHTLNDLRLRFSLLQRTFFGSSMVQAGSMSAKFDITYTSDTAEFVFLIRKSKHAGAPFHQHGSLFIFPLEDSVDHNRKILLEFREPLIENYEVLIFGSHKV